LAPEGTGNTEEPVHTTAAMGMPDKELEGIAMAEIRRLSEAGMEVRDNMARAEEAERTVVVGSTHDDSSHAPRANPQLPDVKDIWHRLSKSRYRDPHMARGMKSIGEGVATHSHQWSSARTHQDCQVRPSSPLSNLSLAAGGGTSSSDTRGSSSSSSSSGSSSDGVAGVLVGHSRGSSMVTMVPGRTVLRGFLPRNPEVIHLRMLVTGEGDFRGFEPKGLDVQ
jgi:hypothetical protein